MNKKVIIGIITLVVIIGAVICLVLMAGNNKESSIIDTKEETKKEETNIKKEEKNNIETWGVEDSIFTENANGLMATLYIKLPEFTSMRRGAGQVADQSDDTLILMGGQHLESPTVSSLKDVLSTYISQPIDVLSKYRRVDWQNYAFNIENTEIVKINGYEMCKYVGNHTYTYNGDPSSMNFVAYATQLKTNGAYVYWMVLDESENQSLTSTIEDYAYKMALTVKEQ